MIPFQNHTLEEAIELIKKEPRCNANERLILWLEELVALKEFQHNVQYANGKAINIVNKAREQSYLRITLESPSRSTVDKTKP